MSDAAAMKTPILQHRHSGNRSYWGDGGRKSITITHTHTEFVLTFEAPHSHFLAPNPYLHHQLFIPKVNRSSDVNLVLILTLTVTLTKFLINKNQVGQGVP